MQLKLGLFASAGRAGIMFVAVGLMAGCATLPSNGPTGADIRRQARNSDNVLGFKITEIDPAVIEAASRDNPDASVLGSLAATGSVDTLGPGDVLSVDIFEVGTGLFSNNRASIGGDALPDASSVPSATTGMVGQGVVVDRNGTISLPYLGRIEVGGLTTDQVQDKIVAGLRGKSQSPQAVVTLRQNVTNTVLMMGAVGRPGRLPLTLAHDRLLDAIAEAGGISLAANTGGSTATGTGPQDIVVRFTRGQRTVEQQMDTILAGAPDDLQLLPGDRIDLIRQPRTFSMFGAIDHIQQIPFESRELTLGEALARAGGPSDARADPHSVYVFRLVQPAPVAAGNGGETVQPRPVIYHLNMMQATSYFYAQRFKMRDKDILYVGNAETNRATKLIQVLSQLFAPIYQVRAISN